MSVGYGFLAMMKSQMQHDFSKFEAKGKLQLNLVHEPKNTFIFDSYEKDQLEEVLDKIKFFADIEQGITNHDFILKEDHLSTIFVPVGTFDDSNKKSANDEMVAAIEGTIYPWFGFAYRIDRIQYSQEHTKIDKVDHSREAIMQAQKMANLFVDEARLSQNQYEFVSHEVNDMNLLLQSDAHQV